MSKPESSGTVLNLNKKDETTESITINVENYAELDMVPDSGSKFWRSPSFDLCGSAWHLRIYPKQMKLIPPTEEHHESRFEDWVDMRLEAAEELPDEGLWVRIKITCSKIYCWGGSNQASVFFKKDARTFGGVDMFCKTKKALSAATSNANALPFKIELTRVGEYVHAAAPPCEEGGGGAAANRDFGALLESGIGADICFIVGKTEQRAHRSLLLARSPVFATMLTEHWSPTATTMANITITDIEPPAFAELLRFVYTGGCSDGAMDEMSAHLYEAAAKYGVADLQAEASRVLVAALLPDNVCDYFALAHAHDDATLKGACSTLVSARMLEVAATDGFKRMVIERNLLLPELTPLLALLVKTVGGGLPETPLAGGHNVPGAKKRKLDEAGGSSENGGQQAKAS